MSTHSAVEVVEAVEADTPGEEEAGPAYEAVA